MRWIEYEYFCNESKGITFQKKVEYNEANLAIAQQEAVNGNYNITEDDEVIETQPLAVELGGTGAKTAEEARMNLGVAYSPVSGITDANVTITKGMLGRTILFIKSGIDFVFTIPKEVSDTLPVGFEIAFAFMSGNSAKIAFTGGVSVGIVGNSAVVTNPVVALPELFTMVAAKKCTSTYWLVTGNVEVV